MKREALMHLDGCHFFVWVSRDPDGQVVLSFDERTGDDLYLHGRWGDDGDENCARCRALRDRKARARHVTKHIGPLPENPKESFLRVATVVGDIDERYDIS